MISGVLPDMQKWEPTLEIIDLSSTTYLGAYLIPHTQFDNLASFIIRNNSLIGSLPSTLVTLSRLTNVDVNLNRMTGVIPTCLFTSRALIYLNLSGNSFSGVIPLQGLQFTRKNNVPSDSASFDGDS